MTMRERMAAGLVSAAVLLGGAVAVTAIEPENVVLAQKIAGNARNSPPIDAPQTEPIIPVRTVTVPPSPKRITYSYQRLLDNDERER